MKKIAVIGGGPKAAAICAKAWCLAERGAEVQVTVFEKSGFGAAWRGRHGYTDGVQKLCTPAERDVGFPHETGLLDEDGIKLLFAEFSWGAFLAEGTASSLGYREWVDRGRKAPTHLIYGRYVDWVLGKCQQKRLVREVTALGHDGDKWSVTYRGRRTAERTFGGFDGVVITGPGPALRGFDRQDDPRIADGARFWEGPERFLARADQSDDPIVIAGSGGTAAAIAAKVVRYDERRPVVIIGSQGALFTRTESFFENNLFTDEEAWRSLTAEDRIAATQRLNRGVVWASVSDVLSAARKVRFRPGRVTAAVVQPGTRGAPEELRVEFANTLGPDSLPASLIVDASGFDPWWFVDLLPAPMQQLTMGRGAVTAKSERQRLSTEIERDLSLDLGAAGLHVPMLSLAQGPGFTSLMVLGSLSERVLKPYVDQT